MPIYDVLVTREASEHNTVRVVASDPKKAERAALKKAGRYGENINGWEVDEGNPHDVYLSDPGNCATEVDGEPELPGEPINDDNVRLDDPETWHEWWHTHPLDCDGDIIVSNLCRIELLKVPCEGVRVHRGSSWLDIPTVQTRGKLRQLLQVLSP